MSENRRMKHPLRIPFNRRIHHNRPYVWVDPAVRAGPPRPCGRYGRQSLPYHRTVADHGRMAPRCETPHPYEPIRCGLPVEHYGSHWAIDHTDELYKWRTVVETQGESAA